MILSAAMREVFQPGSIITSRTSEDGCTISSIECTIEGKEAKLGLQIENNCHNFTDPNQMETIEERIETFSSKLDMVDNKVSIVDEKLDSFENAMNDVEDKVDIVEGKLDLLRQALLNNTDVSGKHSKTRSGYINVTTI